MGSLTSFFPICIPFISFSCFIALAKNSSTILNKSGDSRYPCLVPDFGGDHFQFLPIQYNVGYRSVTYSLYYIEVWILYSQFRKGFFFNHKRDVGFCQQIFLHLLRWAYDSCPVCVYMLYCIYWFAYVEMKLTWSWWMIFLMYCWI
jgi:hypothetical protein